MPFVSKAQERWAFATKQPWAKKWEDQTDGKTLPDRKKVKKQVKRHKDGYKRIVDNKMKWQGDTDVEKKIIRINKKKSKKKSTVIDTIVHEEMHAAHPNMTEKQVYKKTPKVVAKMTPKQKNKMYKKYNFTKAEKKLGLVY